MTVVREERKDLLAEIAKRAGERRAQVQNILERYAKEKDQQPPSPGPAVTAASPKTGSTPGLAGAAAAARMAPTPAPMSPAPSASVRPAPTPPAPAASTNPVSGSSTLERLGEQMGKLDRRVEVVERCLEEGSKRSEETARKQAESVRVLEQSARRSEALARLIEEVARRTERLEARLGEIELRPEPAPAVAEDGLLAVLESRLAEIDQQGARLDGLTESVRQIKSLEQDRSEDLNGLKERLRAFDRLTERIDAMERLFRHQTAQDQRFYALEDAIARLTSQIDQVHRPAPPARIDIVPPAEVSPRLEAPPKLEVGRVETEAAGAPVMRAASAHSAVVPGVESRDTAPVGDDDAQVQAPAKTRMAERRAGAAEPLAGQAPARERDQDKLKGVLDTLARLTAELQEMSEQRRLSAGA